MFPKYNIWNLHIVCNVNIEMALNHAICILTFVHIEVCTFKEGEQALKTLRDVQF